MSLGNMLGHKTTFNSAGSNVYNTIWSLLSSIGLAKYLVQYPANWTTEICYFWRSIVFSHLDKLGSQDLTSWPSHASPSAPWTSISIGWVQLPKMRSWMNIDMNWHKAQWCDSWYEGYLSIVELGRILVTDGFKDLRLLSQFLIDKRVAFNGKG